MQIQSPYQLKELAKNGQLLKLTDDTSKVLYHITDLDPSLSQADIDQKYIEDLPEECAKHMEQSIGEVGRGYQIDTSIFASALPYEVKQLTWQQFIELEMQWCKE